MIQLLKDNKHSPAVSIDKRGKVLIKGELRAENPDAFFYELNQKLNSNLDVLGLERKDLIFVFFFEYLSSSNTMALFSYVKKLGQEEVSMVWQYIEEDEDIEEIGEIIKEGYAPNIKLLQRDQSQ